MPQYVQQGQLSISDGPSKMDLMLALFDGSTAARTLRSVTFTTDIGEVETRINNVGREDGSGECWLFEGYHINLGDEYPRNVKGFFETRRRTGWLRIVS